MTNNYLTSRDSHVTLIEGYHFLKMACVPMLRILGNIHSNKLDLKKNFIIGN